jgi:hydrogenase 3 maturation protease
MTMRRAVTRQCGGDRAWPQGGAASWEAALRVLLREDFALLGVGAGSHGDDAAGSTVARRLAARGIANAIDCGAAPENYLGKVLRMNPSEVLIVDAAEIAREPGAIEVRPGEGFCADSCSTHCAGLEPILHYLASAGSARCWVLCLQPGSIRQGEGLSAPVADAVERIVRSPVWSELSTTEGRQA